MSASSSAENLFSYRRLALMLFESKWLGFGDSTPVLFGSSLSIDIDSSLLYAMRFRLWIYIIAILIPAVIIVLCRAGYVAIILEVFRPVVIYRWVDSKSQKSR